MDQSQSQNPSEFERSLGNVDENANLFTQQPVNIETEES